MSRSVPITTARINLLRESLLNRLPPIQARVAQAQLEAVESIAPVPYKQFVDGSEGAPFGSVIPGGRIVIQFQRNLDVLAWIFEQLYKLSPVDTGAYRADHELWVDGVQTEITPGEKIVTGGSVYVLVNLRPYARRIEHGWSSQAPSGVYEITAVAAQRQFPGVHILFDYLSLGEADPQPSQRRSRATGRFIRGPRSHAHPSSYAYPSITIGEPT
jgi:hypothetical protein